MRARGIAAVAAATAAMAASLALGAGPASASGRSPSAWGTVVGAQQVSEDTLFTPVGCQPDTEVEPAIAMDPNDPDVILAAFQAGRCAGGATGVGYASSRDGGRTWAQGFLPELTKATGGPFNRGDDPAVAFGPDGAAYVATIDFDVTPGCRSSTAVQRSDDHGLTFTPPMFVQDDTCQFFNDKPWIAVDSFADSPHYGRVYVAWLRLGSSIGIVLRHSDDRGQTWGPLVRVNPKGPHEPEGAFPVVQPNGDLTVIYRYRYPAGPMVAQTSHDGGDHFDPPVIISDVHPREPKDLRTGDGIPSASVDPSTGSLFVVWQDKRFEPDGTLDPVLSVSSDGGATWSPVTRVSPPNGDRVLDHFSPAVAASGGFVHVTYLTRLRAPGQFDTVRMNEVTAAEADLAFGQELTLGPEGDLEFAARSGHERFLGDYLGLAADADTVHAVWCLPTPAQPGTLHQTAWSATVLR